jgi:ADP-heptose:LPS heptosyltransferase
MALVAACDLVISSDTGIAHISSAVGTRTVTLFGPTDPTRFWHGATGSRVVQSPELCCSKELHETCLKPSNSVPGFCMKMISESQVHDAVEEGALSGIIPPESYTSHQTGLPL